MTRKTVRSVLIYAGYHSDTKTFTRTYIENRISIQAARAAFQVGYQMKQNGMKCGCDECKGQSQ